MDQTQNSNAADSSLLLPILKQIPLFATLDETQHREIIQHIVMMYYPLNYTLFRQGEEGDALYIIKKGQVDIFKEPITEGDLPSSLATITDGGFFGEMSLVSDVPRNASARTITECEIFILSKTDFKTLLATNTAIAEQISAAMVDRLNANDLTNR